MIDAEKRGIEFVVFPKELSQRLDDEGVCPINPSQLLAEATVKRALNEKVPT